MKAFIFSLICIILVGCEPSKVNIENSKDDTAITPAEPESEIHGGNPAPVTWDTCSAQIGDHACDLALVDQFGDTFQLYDNYNKVILIDFSAMWCGPCNMAASEVESFMLDYGDQDFLWETVLIDNQTGEPVTEDDIGAWSDMYSISTSPVLIGNRSLIDMTGQNGGWPVGGWPTFVILDRELIVKNGIYGWSSALMRQWIEAEL